LAGSIGPLIGGFVAAFAHIRWVFAWTGVLTLLASGWAWWAIRETTRAEE
jgi:MFS family permease